MALHDHFAPSSARPWQEVWSTWTVTMAANLRLKLPPSFATEPRIPEDGMEPVLAGKADLSDLWPEPPTIHSTCVLGNSSAYEVRIHCVRPESRLVAVVQIACPANKETRQNRRAFGLRGAGFLQKGLSVVLLDLVTVPSGSLYAELLDLLGHAGAELTHAPSLSAISCRVNRSNQRPLFESWVNPLQLGESLPTLPLWLGTDLAVPFDLDESYENACRILDIF